MSFAAMTDAVFLDPVISKAASYAAVAGGDPVDVRVVRARPGQDGGGDIFGAPIVSSGTMISVRVTDVADPQVGDTFTIDGVPHTVQGAPTLDIEGLVWTMEAPAGA